MENMNLELFTYNRSGEIITDGLISGEDIISSRRARSLGIEMDSDETEELYFN